MDLLHSQSEKVDPAEMIVAIFRYQVDLDNQVDSVKRSLA